MRTYLAGVAIFSPNPSFYFFGIVPLQQARYEAIHAASAARASGQPRTALVPSYLMPDDHVASLASGRARARAGSDRLRT